MSCSAFELVRRTAGGAYVETYDVAESFAFSLGRIGGVGSGSVSIAKDFSQADHSWRGDEVTVSRRGTVLYAGVVDQVSNTFGRLSLDMIGWSRALDGIKPTGQAFGTESAQPTYDTPMKIFDQLHAVYLSGSQLTLGTRDASGQAIKRMVFNGKQSLRQAFAALADQAGYYAAVVDAAKSLHFRATANLPRVEAKVCLGEGDATSFRCVELRQEAGLNYLDFASQLTVVGTGGYRETFTAAQLRYATPTIAGVGFENARELVRPNITFTTDTAYTPLNGGNAVTVQSVDGARAADRVFAEQSAGPRRYEMELRRVPSVITPWQHAVRLFDGNAEDNGVYRIEEIRYRMEGVDLHATVAGVKIA